jgi:hypothetical protein
MASVELPTSPGPRNVSWELIDFGGGAQGALGGAAQRINRLGNRWRVMVEMPVLTSDDARTWSAALVQGLRLGVLWQIVQPDLSPGSPGTPLVAGAGQSGWTLAADGMTPGYPWRVGQFVSVIVSSRRYVHQFSASGRAGAGGTGTLPIEPALRVTPADNGVIEIGLPYIEGLIEAPSWAYDVDRLARGFSFAVTETR